MSETTAGEPKQSKGEKTTGRILDAAESLFAAQGYDGTSLRQIAQITGIKEPGLYNHFASKQAIYEAVLHRAINPMVTALSSQLSQASDLRDYTDLPSIMTDILFEHPHIAALFQQAMRGDRDAIGNKLVEEWLRTLFEQGLQSMTEVAGPIEDNQATLAINVIALFNITTGYFLSQRAFEAMTEGELMAPENIARQKRLLHKVIRAMLVS